MPVGLRPFLQGGLGVAHGDRRGRQALPPAALYERPRRLDAAVEVDRPDQGFDGVGQEAVAGAPAGGLLADAEQKVGAQAELLPPGGQARPRDEKGLLF